MSGAKTGELAFWGGAVVLSTPRLTLRTFKASDLPGFAALNADLEVMRFLGGRAMEPVESDGLARAIQAGFTVHGFGKLAVERTADGAFLGMCGLSREHWYPDDLEIGWRLDRRYWGRGYATEAALAWLDYAFTKLAAERVISIADVPNLRSIAVMRRIGMVPDHVAELAEGDETFEAAVYAISRESWRARVASR